MKWLNSLEGLFSSTTIKVIFVLWVVCCLFLFGTGVYVVAHFVSKWW